MVHVNVKWGREVLKDVELDTQESPLDFKLKLFSLTGVVPARQRLISSGKLLKDEWTDVPSITEGSTFMLVGTSVSIPVIPKKPTPCNTRSLKAFDHLKQHPLTVGGFVDFGDSRDPSNLKKQAGNAGLKNLGNTCYLNAVIQFLSAATNFREELKSLQVKETSNQKNVVKALIDVWQEIESSPLVVRPSALLENLRSSYAEFGVTDPMGLHIQQDANECLQILMRHCGDSMMDIQNPSRNVADEYFGIDFSVKYKNLDNESDPISFGTEHHRFLNCYITPEVKYMFAGIQLRFKDTVRKQAKGSDVNSSFQKTMTITRLPMYLIVTFVRFYYKGGPQHVNAKILKDIKFPEFLDVQDLCDPSLVEKLAPMRALIRKHEDSVIMGQSPRTTDTSSIAECAPADLQPNSFPEDLGSGNSGLYELASIITHKGRSASSGHYVAWINNAKLGRSSMWRQYDDDVVREVTSRQILDLSGGGDWHTAYVLLYRSRTVPREPQTDGPFAAGTAGDA